MKVHTSTVDLLAGRLAAACPPELVQLGPVHIYRGPAPPAPVAAVIFKIETGSTLPALPLIDRRLRALLPDLAWELDDPEPSHMADADSLANRLGAVAAFLLSCSLRLKLASGAEACVDGKAAVGWFEYFLEVPGMEALGAALVAVGSAVTGTDARRALRTMRQRLDKASAGLRPSFQALFQIEAARRRGIPFLRIANSWAIWQFGWGRKSLHFWTTSSDADGLVGDALSHDKDGTKRLLRQLGLPTPPWLRLGPADDVGRAAEAIGWPCVVKPLFGGSGRGVTAGIRDLAMLEQAAVLARTFSTDILVEAYQPGDDHRLMVIDGRLIAAIRRDPPAVIGDGASTIRTLLDEMNRPREQPSSAIVRYYPVKKDAALKLTLASQNVRLGSIPAKGRRILLRTNSNISTGGTSTNVTAEVHPQIRGLAEQFAAAAGLRTAGLDYITPDISRSYEEVGGAFIETNTTAGIDVILLTGFDSDALGATFLGKRPGRIPVSLVLAPAEQRTPVGDRIAEALAPGAAAATGEWARIGPFRLPRRHRDPVNQVEALLRFPSVNSLVILWTLEDLYRYGLPVDRLDRIVLLGPAPSADWEELLRSRTDALTVAADVAAACEAALVSGREGPR